MRMQSKFDPPSVFVYGTLLFAEVTEALCIRSAGEDGNEAALKRIPAVLDGYQRLTVRPGRRGAYPAIIPGPGHVSGLILSELTEASLAILDEFEGIEDGLYTRELVDVQTADKLTQRVFTYVCGDVIKPHLGSVWDPQAFRASELDWYLKHVVTS